ncbi:hypothetical protein SEUCBS139899_001229 [Sporothrix eucalyptigena]|uniref:Methyltransferase domain-containing protein n=1 Tax=Sporothrix eucalyptigena TaxID=1812306 RepID=A0ABP0BT98_9PEZI
MTQTAVPGDAPEKTTEQKLGQWNKHAYFDELPDNLGPMRKLLAEYSHVPEADIDAHLYAIRDKLWAVFQYPCIGRFSFLDLGMTKSPYYQESVKRLQASSSERLLDLGCCVGQVLRQLVHNDGVAPRQLSGSDLHREFLELGYELFRDGPPSASEYTFVAGDVVSETPDHALDALDKTVTMVNTANVFHLFDWAEQVRLGKRMVGFLKEDAPKDKGTLTFYGCHLSARVACEHRVMPTSPKTRYLHDATSFQKLWDEIGVATGTQWTITQEQLPMEIGVALTGDDNVQYVLFGVRRA